MNMQRDARKIKKRILCLIFALMFICICSSPVSAYAATPSFTMKDVDGVSAEEEVRLAISLKDSKVSVGAFSFSITYDATVLRYVNGSLTSTYFDDISVYVKDGKLNFVWESSKNVSVKTGVVFYMTFVTTSSFAQDTVVEMAKGSVYAITEQPDGEMAFTDVYEKASSETVSATITPKSGSNNDADVENVIQKIDAIPDTVVATEEYKNVLEEALNAYANLTYAQQKKVTNYDELVKKYNEYLGLANNSVSQEAQEWINNDEWKYTFDLTASTATFADREKIENALTAWEQLSAGARYETTKERLFLKSLISILDELYAEEIEKQEQEALLAQAQSYVEQYKEEWKNVLILETEKVSSEHLEVIKQAESALNTMQGLGAYDLAYNMLVTDGIYAHLQELKEKALEEYAKENPEDAEYILLAEKFRSQFGYVLGMDVQDITYDDIADINTAYVAYDFLDEKTKSYLKTEYTKLEELMAACDDVLPEEEDDDMESDDMEMDDMEMDDMEMDDMESDDMESNDEESETKKETLTVKEVIKWLNGSDDYNITFMTRGISQFIWIFLALDMAALLLLVGTKVMFWIVKRKYKQYGEQEV